uniref:Uncharacterized protein n=1 Tax=Cucumis melo TaxID=3656 RepID=A0A9I9CI02_CUCME
MSQDDVRASHPARASKGRPGSNGSKRWRGGQRVGAIKITHQALECANNQLRLIAEWPSHAL